MKPQFKFFDETSEDVNQPTLPEGMRYETELINRTEENALVTRIRELPFKEFEFHGFKGKRRTVSFGWQYEFSGRGSLRKADDIPEFLLPLRAVAAKLAQIKPESLQHVLVIEYGPGAGIGWHRDKPVFGEVVGVSLLAPCVVRFRRKVAAKATLDHKELPLTKFGWNDKYGSRSGSDRVFPTRSNSKWERINLLAEPRSAYHLTGAARSEWEHSILRVDELRYSITFRTLLQE